MLPVWDSKLFSGLLHNPCEPGIVGVADVRTQMMCDMVVEPACEPTDEPIFRRVVGRGGKDVVDTVVKFAAL